MRVIRPDFEILSDVDGKQILKALEVAGRTCYKSEDKITDDSAEVFVKMLIERGHEAMLEHESITVKVVCDRGVSHEIVRHRLASYAQESTRYCNYSKNKFGQELTFIVPCFWGPNDEELDIWLGAMETAESIYMDLINRGAKPQQARSVLPNSLKTEIVITMNLREWRHFFKLRTAMAAHPQMCEIARPMLDEFKILIPVIFDDISYEE